MNNDEIKVELKNDLIKYVETVNKLPIKHYNKTEIIQRYVFSKFKWRLSVYHLTDTYIWKIIRCSKLLQLVNMIRRYLIFNLSNGTTLQRWKPKGIPNCILFQKKETQLYLFNHCTSVLGRYELRYDYIIQIIVKSLAIIASDTCRMYGDIKQLWISSQSI